MTRPFIKLAKQSNKKFETTKNETVSGIASKTYMEAVRKGFKGPYTAWIKLIDESGEKKETSEEVIMEDEQSEEEN